MNCLKHMLPLPQRASGLLALLIAVSLSPQVTDASEPAGRVLSSVGYVAAIDADGNERTLTRNDVVYPGERITTGPRGRVQLRFRDDGLVDLKPQTAFEIESYREPTAERGGSAVFNFLRGALRTITGTIGTRADDEYQMTTTVATIGVRGTDYALQYCEEDCAERHRPGLYGHVTGDRVIVDNAHGDSEFREGQYFLVPRDDAPMQLVRPPPGILDAAEDGRTLDRAAAAAERLARLPAGVREKALETLRAYVASQGGTLDAEWVETVFESADVTSDDLRTSSGEDSPCCLSFSTTGSSSGSPVFNLTSVVPVDSPDSIQQYTQDESGIVRNIRFADTSTGESIELDYASTPVEQTGSNVGVNWGLLSGGWDLISEDAQGQVQTVALDAGGLAFALADDLTSPTALGGRSGSVSYLPVGGPDAIDSLGNLWNVTDLQVGVDFTAGTAGLDTFQLDEIGGLGGQVILVEPAAITLDTDRSGIGAVFNDAGPLVAAYTQGPRTGDANVQFVGIFVGQTGTVMSTTFGADLIDAQTSSPFLEISGAQVLEEAVR